MNSILSVICNKEKGVHALFGDVALLYHSYHILLYSFNQGNAHIVHEYLILSKEKAQGDQDMIVAKNRNFLSK